MMSLPAMSFGDRFCESRKGGTGEVGGCTYGCIAVCVPSCRKALVST